MTDTKITRGTANVFADLGLSDPSERQTKTRLALAINRTPLGVILRGFGNNARAMQLSGWSPIRQALWRYGFSGHCGHGITP